MKERRFASRMQIVAIHQRLTEVLEVLGPDVCRYKGTASDESVAVELGVTAANVAGVRKEGFGRFPKASGGGTDHSAELATLRQELEATKNTLTLVDSRLHDLEVKHNKLCETLSLNKVVTVNHLTVLTAGVLAKRSA